MVVSSALMILFCVLEALMYFLYNNKLHPRIEIVKK
jgi:hypothetical protein